MKNNILQKLGIELQDWYILTGLKTPMKPTFLTFFCEIFLLMEDS